MTKTNNTDSNYTSIPTWYRLSRCSLFCRAEISLIGTNNKTTRRPPFLEKTVPSAHQKSRILLDDKKQIHKTALLASVAKLSLVARLGISPWQCLFLCVSRQRVDPRVHRPASGVLSSSAAGVGIGDRIRKASLTGASSCFAAQ